MWEILIPADKDGKEIPQEFHNEWDAKVREIAGGLTIYKPLKGQWQGESGPVSERVIPVRIACTNAEIKKIARLAAEHYAQHEVLYTMLNRKVYIVRAKKKEEANA
jgi:hypothetical protein